MNLAARALRATGEIIQFLLDWQWDLLVVLNSVLRLLHHA